MNKPFVLIHISDLHIHRVPLSPRQWTAKRGLGALNLVLNRRRQFPRARARALVDYIDNTSWDHLLITGDLTQLGTRNEMESAHALLRPLLRRGAERVTILPGNHDRYVPESGADGFGEVFGEFFGGSEVVTKFLADRWWLCGWDSARPRGLFSAEGYVRDETLRATETWWRGLPDGALVILANHYPIFFPPGYKEKRRHDLTNLEPVREWIVEHPPRLYLHGHDHENWSFMPPEFRVPMLAVNSASSTRVPQAGETSVFHRIVLSGTDANVQDMNPQLN